MLWDEHDPMHPGDATTYFFFFKLNTNFSVLCQISCSLDVKYRKKRTEKEEMLSFIAPECCYSTEQHSGAIKETVPPEPTGCEHSFLFTSCSSVFAQHLPSSVVLVD